MAAVAQLRDLPPLDPEMQYFGLFFGGYLSLAIAAHKILLNKIHSPVALNYQPKHAFCLALNHMVGIWFHGKLYEFQ